MTPDGLSLAISAHRARLLAAFRNEGAESWADARSSYGVGEQSARDAELRACLEAVAAWGRMAAAQVEGGAALVMQLDALVRETMKEIAPATGAKAGLAAIFANATANAGWWKQQWQGISTTQAARCRSCGARQETALVFDCPYCGQFLYAAPGEGYS